MQKNSEVDYLLSQNNPPVRQRRQRTNFNEDAIQFLEESFAKNPYPDMNERESMALKLNTSEDRIQVWFQNKRARYRKKMHKKENLATSESNSDNVNVIPIRTNSSKAFDPCRVHSTPQLKARRTGENISLCSCSSSSSSVSSRNDSGIGSSILAEPTNESNISSSFLVHPYSPLVFSSSPLTVYSNAYLRPQNIVPTIMTAKNDLLVSSATTATAAATNSKPLRSAIFRPFDFE